MTVWMSIEMRHWTVNGETSEREPSYNFFGGGGRACQSRWRRTARMDDGKARLRLHRRQVLELDRRRIFPVASASLPSIPASLTHRPWAWCFRTHGSWRSFRSAVRETASTAGIRSQKFNTETPAISPRFTPAQLHLKETERKERWREKRRAHIS